MAGECSWCGSYNECYCSQQASGNSSSMPFWPNYDHSHYYISSSSPSPSVDCTLSLGPPTTDKPTPRRNSVSSSWHLLNSHPTHSNFNTTTDPPLPRRCSNCHTTSTPLWRNGPQGPKSLCNACGIRYKKEERRSAAAAAAAAAQNGGAVAAGMMHSHNSCYQGSSWAHHYSQANPQKMQCYAAPSNEFRIIQDDDHGSDNAIQFLSWLS